MKDIYQVEYRQSIPFKNLEQCHYGVFKAHFYDPQETLLSSLPFQVETLLIWVNNFPLGYPETDN